jgi:hypothetical protein
MTTASAAPRARHLKRGSSYDVIGTGRTQTSVPIGEDEVLVAYRSEDGRLWFRPIGEFDDGRFEPLPAADLLTNENGNPKTYEQLAREVLTKGRDLELERQAIDHLRTKLAQALNASEVVRGELVGVAEQLLRAAVDLQAAEKRIEELEREALEREGPPEGGPVVQCGSADAGTGP